MKKFIGISLLIGTLTGCGNVEAEVENKRFTYQDTGEYDLTIVIDNESGCKYLQYDSDREGGITPLLKWDGTPDCK